MADLDDARDEIREFLTDTAAKDPNLIGLVFTARQIGENLDMLTVRLDETNRLLRIMADVLSKAAAAAAARDA
jgi:hypothetical protein